MDSAALPAETDVVIIGAGIVGACLAYKLAEHGAKRVLLVDKGAAYATGGSTSHAPGGLIQVFHLGNPLLTNWCYQSAEVYNKLGTFHNIGSLELAWSEERMEVLRAVEQAASAGKEFDVKLVSPREAKAFFPLLQTDGMKGALHTALAGRVDAVLAVERMIEAAGQKMGSGFASRFLTPIAKILIEKQRVVGVQTEDGHVVHCQAVAICCGAWGNELLKPLGRRLAMANIEHVWALTKPLPQLPTPTANLYGRPLHPSDGRHQSLGTVLPAIYDGDGKVYYQTYGQQLGVGSYGHVARIYPDTMSKVSHAEAPFNPADFQTAWQHSKRLFGAAFDEAGGLALGFNGLMTGTPDGMPLAGELAGIQGLWVGEACWIKYAVGLGDALARALLFADKVPAKVDVNRFDLNEWTQAAIDEAVGTGYENRTEVPKVGAKGWHGMYSIAAKL